MAKKDGKLWQGIAGLALIVFALVGYRLGLFSAIGRLLVDHAITSTQQEVERQRNQSK